MEVCLATNRMVDASLSCVLRLYLTHLFPERNKTGPERLRKRSSTVIAKRVRRRLNVDAFTGCAFVSHVP